MDPESNLTRWVYRYDRNGCPWAFIRVRERQGVEGPVKAFEEIRSRVVPNRVEKALVQIPSRIWMLYPKTRAVVDIKLSDIRLGVVIPPSQFQIDASVRTGGTP